jgi:hypothetical protein
MNIHSFPFQTIDWTHVPREEHKGESGMAYWQTKMMNNIRVRRVEYSAGYKADHWCKKGHVLFCMEGSMNTELEDGRILELRPDMCYFVGDNSEAHRSFTTTGCQLFIVD